MLFVFRAAFRKVHVALSLLFGKGVVGTCKCLFLHAHLDDSLVVVVGEDERAGLCEAVFLHS